MSGADAALRLAAVTQRYPGVVALDGVDLTVAAGTVRGLVGQNGAGKSTLSKVAAGIIHPDSGSVHIAGRELTASDPRRATELGIAMIHQELAILPDMTAIDNVLLGRAPTYCGAIRRGAARRRYRELADSIGCTIEPSTYARDISTSGRQLLEIMRALALETRVIIMDEPTASLGPQEVARLHRVIRGLADRGTAVIYVSHDLDAVLEVSDEVTTMRDGQVVNTCAAASLDHRQLVELMLGTQRHTSVVPPPISERTPARLVIRDVQGPGVDVAELTVRRGEILGVAGLVGSGRSRLLRALSGDLPGTTGHMSIDGNVVGWPSSRRAALRLGLAYAPEDRKSQALVLHRSTSWNVALGRFGAVAGSFAVREQALRRGAHSVATRVGLAEQTLGVAVGTLSGGNQQKSVLARLLDAEPKCIVLDEPTRGIDVNAKDQIFDQLSDFASHGHSVIWASSELDDLTAHSHRIAVVSAGALVAELDGGTAVETILRIAFENVTRVRNERTPS